MNRLFLVLFLIFFGCATVQAFPVTEMDEPDWLTISNEFAQCSAYYLTTARVNHIVKKSEEGEQAAKLLSQKNAQYASIVAHETLDENSALDFAFDLISKHIANMEEEMEFSVNNYQIIRGKYSQRCNALLELGVKYIDGI